MAEKKAAAKTETKPAEQTPAPAETTETEEVFEEREYVPADDDGLTSIDEVDDGDDTEVDPDDEGWGYDGLTDDEVADPEAVKAAEDADAETEES